MHNARNELLTIRIETVVLLEKTGLLLAYSDDMKGLYVHAHNESELLERIPIAIRAILEAKGRQVLEVQEIAPSASDAGLAATQRTFDALLAADSAGISSKN